jgi:hypothetical protein
MDSTLNRPLSKKIVSDSRFYYCIRITYQGEHYGHVWFWEGSTPLGVAALKVLLFFKKCWRCTTLEDHISRSTWPIWAKVCLLGRSNSLLLRKNMNNEIYRLLPILGRGQYLVRYIFRGTSDPTGSL